MMLDPLMEALLNESMFNSLFSFPFMHSSVHINNGRCAHPLHEKIALDSIPH